MVGAAGGASFFPTLISRLIPLSRQNQHKGHDEKVDQRGEKRRSKPRNVLHGIDGAAGENVEHRLDEVIGEGGDDAREGARR